MTFETCDQSDPTNQSNYLPKYLHTYHYCNKEWYWKLFEITCSVSCHVDYTECIPISGFSKSNIWRAWLGLGWVGHSARSGFDLAQVMTTGRPTNHVYVRHISALNVHHNSAWIRHTGEKRPTTGRDRLNRPTSKDILSLHIFYLGWQNFNFRCVLLASNKIQNCWTLCQL